MEKYNLYYRNIVDNLKNNFLIITELTSNQIDPNINDLHILFNPLATILFWSDICHKIKLWFDLGI